MQTRADDLSIEVPCQTTRSVSNVPPHREAFPATFTSCGYVKTEAIILETLEAKRMLAGDNGSFLQRGSMS